MDTTTHLFSAYLTWHSLAWTRSSAPGRIQSLKTIDASALTTALASSSRSPVAFVAGLAICISSVGLLCSGATLPDPLSHFPGVAANRVAVAPFIPSPDAVEGTGDPGFLFIAIDSTAANQGVGSAIAHDHPGAEPPALLTLSADNRRRTNWAIAGLATELGRGKRAESAHLATIETRRNDARALLLRTAAWNRERGRTSG
jgi:hypothetical protein